MNKKKLLLILLALAIVTSLSAGTLAIYTKTVSTSEKVQAKRFAFASTGTTSVSTDGIQLAPGETADYGFTVTNYNVDSTGKKTGDAAEVPLQYQITVDWASALSGTASSGQGNLENLTATLYQDGTKLTTTDTSGKLTYTSEKIEENTATESDYVVKLTWQDKGSQDAKDTEAGSSDVTFAKGLKITVTANQYVADSDFGDASNTADGTEKVFTDGTITE